MTVPDAPPVQPESQAPPVEPAQAPPDAPKETDWKAEARKWESRAKENSTAAERLAEIEEANKTELQKAVERAEAAEKRAADSDRGRAKADIAREMGVPPRFVVGESEDEMREAAQEYLDDRKSAQDDRVRRAEVDQGPRGDSKPTQLTRDDLKGMSPAQIVAAKNEGRLSGLLTDR